MTQQSTLLTAAAVLALLIMISALERLGMMLGALAGLQFAILAVICQR